MPLSEVHGERKSFFFFLFLFLLGEDCSEEASQVWRIDGVPGAQKGKEENFFTKNRQTPDPDFSTRMCFPGRRAAMDGTPAKAK